MRRLPASKAHRRGGMIGRLISKLHLDDRRLQPLRKTDAIGSRSNARVRVSSSAQSTKPSTEYITTVYSALLQTFGRAHIVATRVVASGCGDGSLSLLL